jgi:hypothetical protein
LNLEKMVEISKELSKGFPFIRVDLYSPGDRIVFGELTFYPEAGFCIFQPEDYDLILGNDLILP